MKERGLILNQIRHIFKNFLVNNIIKFNKINKR